MNRREGTVLMGKLVTPRFSSSALSSWGKQFLHLQVMRSLFRYSHTQSIIINISTSPSSSQGKDVPVLNFTFEKAVELLFIKFDLISFWGVNGGGLQFFAASKWQQNYQIWRSHKRNSHTVWVKLFISDNWYSISNILLSRPGQFGTWGRRWKCSHG